MKDHCYLSNIKHSVSLYGEQIIIVFVVVVIVTGWEGDWRKLPWTGMSLQMTKLKINENVLFFVAFTDQFLFPVPLIHLPNRCRSRGSDHSLLISGNHIQMAKALNNNNSSKFQHLNLYNANQIKETQNQNIFVSNFQFLSIMFLWREKRTPALEFLLPRASGLSRKGSLCTCPWNDRSLEKRKTFDWRKLQS